MAATSFAPLLATGVEAGASDWHIRQDSTVILRVDGRLIEVEGFVTTKDFLEQAVSEITTDKDMRNYEEHGDADFAHQEEDVGRFRVNLHRQRGLMSLTLRHIKAKVPDFAKLGLP